MKEIHSVEFRDQHEKGMLVSLRMAFGQEFR